MDAVVAVVSFSSAGWAKSITSLKLSVRQGVCVCVCVCVCEGVCVCVNQSDTNHNRYVWDLQSCMQKVI